MNDDTVGNKYYQIIENMPDGFMLFKAVTDEKGIIIDYIVQDINKSFEKLMGLKIEDIASRKISDLTREKSLKDFKLNEICFMFNQPGGGIIHEIYCKRLSKWFSIHISTDCEYLSAVFHDITESKNRADKIDTLYKSIVEFNETPYMDIDYQRIAKDLLVLSKAVVILVNIYDSAAKYTVTRGFATMSGFAEKVEKFLGVGVLGKAWDIKESDLTVMKSRKLVKIGRLHEFSFERIPVNVVKIIEEVLKLDDCYGMGITYNGEIQGSFIIMMQKDTAIEYTDIIELYINQISMLLLRKKAEEEFEKLGQEYSTVFNSSQDPIFLVNVDKDNRISYHMINKGYEEDAGVPMSRIKGMTPVQVFGEEIGSQIEGKYHKCVCEKKSIKYEETYYLMGRTKTWHTLLSPIIKDGRVVQIAGSSRDITELKQHQEKIKYLGFHDKLTGLYNRAHFEEELERLDKEGCLPIGIILGDANGLKMVNDAFGHEEGDRFLKLIGNIFSSTCGEDTIVSRVGGDEFAVILPGAGSDKVIEVAARIKDRCAVEPADPIQPSIALGTAVKDSKAQDINKIYKHAEDRMYNNKLVESKGIRSSIILSLKKTLEERTHETEAHAIRMKELAIKLGKVMGLYNNELDELSLLAMLHDIGKIAIPDHILGKPGSLSQEEWRIMKNHSEIGYRIAAASPELAVIANLILCHHEWWDGSGYPQGLKGGEIPLLSRIIAVIDAFDAMVNDRPYHKAIPAADAVKELERCAGTQFDPGIVKEFVKIITS